MTVLLVMAVAVVVLFVGGRFYSSMIARRLGEDPSRPTPAVAKADGRDYVPTPTPVVFAHHFASIAGAGPILGPVIAIIYGWVPAVLWVIFGGLLIGSVHDYLATYMTTREGGTSIATIVRRLIGTRAFIAITVLLIVMLALVCAAFLNASATALTSMLPFDRLDLPKDQKTFRVVPGRIVDYTDKKDKKNRDVIGLRKRAAGKDVLIRKEDIDGKAMVLHIELVNGKERIISKAEIIESKIVAGKEVVVRKRPHEQEVVIGGIASMSVVCITLVAPLIGFMYLKKRVPVWICSILAVLICGVSITVGVLHPVRLNPDVWKLLLSGYVLIAAGVPVWIFLQSRDFINVHILYVGMVALVVTLVVAGLRGAGVTDLNPQAVAIPQFNIEEGTRALGFFWPGMFIVIACGAVSGFHSLCAGGTTCKQITTEKATRQIGYYGMLLESFLAVCVIGVLMVGAIKADYVIDVHPKTLGGLPGVSPNWVLGFAMAVGNAAKLAYGVPIVAGALAGMVLLEGFLVTTLDTAIRLTRYLFEEIWRTLFGKFDVFAAPVAAGEPSDWPAGEQTPVGAGGIPDAPVREDQPPAPALPVATTGLLRAVLRLLRMYWFNSAIAVGLMLSFALTGGQKALWQIFATSNQLLAAMVLAIASLWLLRRRRSLWFAFIPGVLMMITTVTNLILMLKGFLADPGKNATLLAADVFILVITIYLVIVGVREAVRTFARLRAEAPVTAE